MRWRRDPLFGVRRRVEISASFDVFVDSPNPTAFAPFFAIWLSTADYTFYEIALTTNAAGAISMLENLTYLDDAGSASPTTAINGVTLVANAWNHVDFNVNLSGSNFVDVAINDGPARAVALQHRPSAGSVRPVPPLLGHSERRAHQGRGALRRFRL